MAAVNCTTGGNEIGTDASANPEYGMLVSKKRLAFKMTGGILALSFVAVMQSAYGGESSGVSHSATSTQVAPGSSIVNTPGTSSMGFDSLTAGAENAPKIVWEPIGKYSQKEINLVSDTVGKLFSHMKKMEAIESGAAPLVRNGEKTADKGAMLRAARNYSVEAQEESKKIDQFQMPALKNQQAAEMLSKAKAALRNASGIQKERASKLVKMVSGDADSKTLSGEIQQLGSQRISAAFQFLSAYMAYESYGFTSDQIDLATGRLKKDAKPDRVEPEPQTAKKNTP